MKKIVRLTETDLVRLVKRVIEEQSKPDVGNANSMVLGFIKFIQTLYGAEQFGKGKFMQKPNTSVSTASNLSLTREDGKKISIPGEQLYRIKLKSILDKSNPYMNIELDKRGLSTKPSVNISYAGEFQKFDLLTQMDELKSYINDNTTNF